MQQVYTTRRDSEAIEEVNVEAISGRPYKLYLESLSVADKKLLGIFLTGAVSTGTRRQTGRPCAHCGAPWP
eukprot:3104603-Pyramimonas_sp.AAC.1